MATVREQFLDGVVPLLPSEWKFVPYQRNLDRLSQTTLMLKQSTVKPLPTIQGAGAGWQADYILTIISPNTDPEKAETQLDDDVLTLLETLATVMGSSVKQATRAQWGENGPSCYDIELTFTGKATS